MRRWLRPFLTALYAYRRNQTNFKRNRSEIVDFERIIWGGFLTHPSVPTHRSLYNARLNVEIYTDACDRPPMENDEINWGARRRNRGNLGN